MLLINFDIVSRWAQRIDEVHAEIGLMIILVAQRVFSRPAVSHRSGVNPNDPDSLIHFLE
jgi:hypothetical protein